jgi:hypothetical protein
MSKKVILALLIAVTVVLAFSACTRSASPNIISVPTSTPEGLIPAVSQPTDLPLVQAWGTSTAIYMQTAQAMGLITATSTPLPQSTESTTPVVPPAGVPTNTPLPGTTPIVIVPTATPGRPATYPLHDGEHPFCLARRFNVDPDALLAANGLTETQARSLPIGTTLTIPQTGSYPGNRALTPHPAQYTVAVNDSIYRIACHYGDVDPSAIAAANGIALTTPLTTGQILNIP